MALLLKLTTGPLAGQSFPVSDGLTIGRSGATINISDPKVSTTHARLNEAGGRWILKDNKSKNGVRDAAGERVISLEIKAGAVFQIGDSTFQVEHSEPVRRPTPAPQAAPDVGGGEPTAVAQAPKEKAKKRQILWNDALADFLEAGAKKFRDKPRKIEPMEPALVLEFVRGAQVNSRWLLGFGPRKIGPACLDLPIWEPDAPPVCFEIHPDDEGLIFKTDHPEMVRLNGQKVDRQVLRMGDTIQINETLIEVDFNE